MSYCAIFMQNHQDNARVFTLRSKEFQEAKQEAERYRKRLKSHTERIESYRFLVGRNIPILVWSKVC